VRDAIGGAEKPLFKSGSLKAVIYPDTGILHIYREREPNTADPIMQTRPWEIQIPLDEAEALSGWLMSQYGDFDGPTVKPKSFL